MTRACRTEPTNAYTYKRFRNLKIILITNRNRIEAMTTFGAEDLSGTIDNELVKSKAVLFASRSLWSSSTPGGEGTPLYGLYRYVRPQRVGFFSRFGHKLGIDFSHFATILVINRVSIFAL